MTPTPLTTLERACEIGRQAGLKFIYTGNVQGSGYEDTKCYHCGNVVVQRRGYEARVLGLNGSKCSFCGSELNFRMEPPQGGRK